MKFSSPMRKQLEELAAIADESGNQDDAIALRSLLSEETMTEDPFTAYRNKKYNLPGIKQRFGDGIDAKGKNNG